MSDQKASRFSQIIPPCGFVMMAAVGAVGPLCTVDVATGAVSLHLCTIPQNPAVSLGHVALKTSTKAIPEFYAALISHYFLWRHYH